MTETWYTIGAYTAICIVGTVAYIYYTKRPLGHKPLPTAASIRRALPDNAPRIDRVLELGGAASSGGEGSAKAKKAKKNKKAKKEGEEEEKEKEAPAPPAVAKKAAKKTEKKTEKKAEKKKEKVVEVTPEPERDEESESEAEEDDSLARLAGLTAQKLGKATPTFVEKKAETKSKKAKKDKKASLPVPEVSPTPSTTGNEADDEVDSTGVSDMLTPESHPSVVRITPSNEFQTVGGKKKTPNPPKKDAPLTDSQKKTKKLKERDAEAKEEANELRLKALDQHKKEQREGREAEEKRVAKQKASKPQPQAQAPAQNAGAGAWSANGTGSAPKETPANGARPAMLDTYEPIPGITARDLEEDRLAKESLGSTDDDAGWQSVSRVRSKKAGVSGDEREIFGATPKQNSSSNGWADVPSKKEEVKKEKVQPTVAELKALKVPVMPSMSLGEDDWAVDGW